MRIGDVMTPNLPELAALGGEAAMLRARLRVAGQGRAWRWRASLTDSLDRRRRRDAPLGRPADRHAPHARHRLHARQRHRGRPRRRASRWPTRSRARASSCGSRLREAPGLGGGHGPMGHQAVRLDLGSDAAAQPDDAAATDHAASCAFYTALGLTPDRRYRRRALCPVRNRGRRDAVDRGGGATADRRLLECEDLDAEVARLAECGRDGSTSCPTEQPGCGARRG